MHDEAGREDGHYSVTAQQLVGKWTGITSQVGGLTLGLRVYLLTIILGASESSFRSVRFNPHFDILITYIIRVLTAYIVSMFLPCFWRHERTHQRSNDV